MDYLIDTHVHFHRCYSEVAFIDGACANFRVGAGELGLASEFIGCMFLTECNGDYYFRKLQRHIGERIGEEWLVQSTFENNSLVLEKDGVTRLILVAGRQIVTKENLEVLALGTATDFDNGSSLEETVSAVRSREALPVLPWGFGKWYGKRGKIVSDYLKTIEEPDLFLGDSSCRLRYWKKPSHFKIAAARGIRIIPGSDTLPLKSCNRSAGRYGVMLSGPLDEKEPTNALKRLLCDRTTAHREFGRCSGVFVFVYHQVIMQLRKQTRK